MPTIDNLKYTIVDASNVTVNGFDIAPTSNINLVIPSTVTYNSVEYNVTNIDISAFQGISYITSVVIPDSVTLISGFAFFNCTGLTSFTMGNNVQFIGQNAFQASINIQSLVIPNSVTYVGTSAFAGITGLTSLTIGNGITTAGRYCFQSLTGLKYLVYDCSISLPDSDFNYSALLSVTIGDTTPNVPKFNGAISLTSVTIGKSVTSIPTNMFINCSGLTSVIVDVSNTVLKIIDSYAFKGCSSLPSFIMPNSVTTVGVSTFENCTSLTSIQLSNSLNNIGIANFNNCSKLLSVTIPNTATYIGDNAFSVCIAMTNITIGTSVTSIGISAFNGCSVLNNVVIPDSVTLISGFAFFNCAGLTSFTMGNNVQFIGQNAFQASINIQSLVIPNSITYVGTSAFAGITGLTSLTIGNGITTAGRYCFSNLTGLKYLVYDCSISLPDSAFNYPSLLSATIGDTTPNANTISFNGATSLTSVVIGKSVTSIPGYMFNSCSSLTSVTVDASNTVLKIIDSYAFKGCSSLPSFTMPNSVTTIGDYTFQNCTSLTNIQLSNSLNKIGDFNFNGCTKLLSATIPNTVTNIGQYAYSGCIAMTNITIGTSVTSTGVRCFEDCSAVTSVILPDSLTSIGDYSFFRCYSISTLTFGNNPNFTTIGNAAFHICKSLQSVTIPISVTSIGWGCFKDSNIVNLTILSNPTAGTDAFTGVTGLQYLNINSEQILNGYNSSMYVPLKSLIIGNSVINIGDYRFNGCTNLTSVNIGSGVTSIGNYTFQGCSALTSLSLGTNIKTIGSYAFKLCTGLSAITLPDFVTSVGTECFRGCSGLTSVILDASLNTIGTSTFYDCSNIPTIVIPNSVQGIGDSAFVGCKSLTSATIGTGVIRFENSAFNGCSGLQSITIPNATTFIGTSAFNSCTGLTSATVGSGVIISGSLIFANCSLLNTLNCESAIIFNGSSNNFTNSPVKNLITGNILTTTAGTGGFGTTLTSVTLGTALTSISAGNFSYCTKISSITIPNNIKSIGDSAFLGCTGLTNIIIPDSVTNMSNDTFAGCSKLTSITLGSSLTSIGSTTFYNDVSLNSIVIPASVTSIGQQAFYNCNSLTSVTYGNLKNIEKWAFQYCSKLTSAYIPASVTTLGYQVFNNCNAITSIIIENCPATYTGSDLFSSGVITDVSINSQNLIFTFGKAALKNIYLGPNIIYLPESLFNGINGLTNVVLTNGLTDMSNAVFANCTSLKTITLPDTLKTMGSSSFVNCTNLTSVTFSNILKRIGDSAFNNCSSLTNIIIPDSVTNMSNDTFAGCSKLTSITLGSSLTSIGSTTFYNDVSLNSIVIPASVTSIGTRAFFNCNSMTSVTYSNNIKTFGDWAFQNCSKLTSAYIPASVTTLGYQVFTGCNAITSITIENCPATYTGSDLFSSGVITDISINSQNLIFTFGKGASKNVYFGPNITYLPDSLFLGATSLTNVTFTSGLTDISNNVFNACTSLQNIILPNSLKTIGNASFANCTKLTSITLSNTLKSIGDSAFVYSNALQSIVIPDSVTSILNSAFASMSNLTSITLGAGLINILDGAFASDISLNSIIIPNAVTNIAYRAFYNCSKITSAIIGNNVKTLGQECFRDCIKLTSINIPASITSIGLNPFLNCSLIKIAIIDNTTATYVGNLFTTIEDLSINSMSLLPNVPKGPLKKIYFGPSITSIYYQAFMSANNLTSVQIPISVTSLADQAFRDCAVLSSATIDASINAIGPYTFYNCPSLKNISISNTVLTIGDSAFRYAPLTSLTIPNSVTYIHNMAFANCSKITNLTIGNGIVTGSNSTIFSSITDLSALSINSNDMLLNGGLKRTGLINLTLGDSITAIPINSFNNLSKLVNLIIGKNVTTIGSGAFQNCPLLLSISFGFQQKSLKNINSNNDIIYLTSIGDNAFKDCISIIGIAIPNSVTNLGNYVFSGCTSLRRIKLSEFLVNIGNFAFNGCSLLSLVETSNLNTWTFTNNSLLPNSLTSLGTHAFSSCISLKNINVGTGITTIKEYTFSDCTGLTSIIIPDNVLSIEQYAFLNCSSLFDISLPGNLTVISNNLFSGCSSITSINIPLSVTAINSNIFEYCNNLTSVTLFNNITSISNTAFSGALYYDRSLGSQVYGTIYTNSTGSDYLSTYLLNNSLIGTNVIQKEFTPTSYSVNVENNYVIISGDYFADISTVLFNDTIAPVSYIVNSSKLITALVNSVFLINSVYIKDINDVSTNFILNIPLYTNVNPQINSVLTNNYNIVINGINFLNIKEVLINNIVTPETFTINNNQQITIPVYNNYNIYSIKVTDDYYNTNVFTLTNPISTIIPPYIGYVDFNTPNIISVFGINYENVSSIYINNNSYTFTKINNTLINIDVSNIFLVNDTTISDLYDNSYNYMLIPAKYTNILPLPISIDCSSSGIVKIIGNNLSDVKSIILNDVIYSQNINIIDNTLINYYVNTFFQISKVTVINSYDTSNNLLLSNPIYTNIPPVITDISSSLVFKVEIFGTNFNNIISVSFNNNTIQATTFTNNSSTNLIVDVSSVFLINDVTIIDGYYNETDTFTVSNPFYTNVPPILYDISSNKNYEVEISGINLDNVKSVFLNDTIQLTDISYNNNILTAKTLDFLKINKLTVIDGYNNIVDLQISKTIYTNIPPIITDISSNTNFEVEIYGLNLKNLKSIYFNNETIQGYITSLNNTIVLVGVSNVFQINDVLITDNYDNSANLIVSTPFYTNVPPIVTKVENNNDFQLLITGTRLLNTQQIILLDASGETINLNTSSFIINGNTLIKATITTLIQLDKVTVVDGYNNSILFDVNPDIITDVPPIITSIDCSINNIVSIYGTTFANINNIIFNNSVSPTFFVVISDQLLKATVNSVFSINSVYISDIYDNSNNYIQNPSIYTNVIPSITDMSSNVNNEIEIFGLNMLNLKSILINDSIQSNILTIADNVVTGSISSLFQINNITITDYYDNSVNFIASIPFYTNVVPILYDISSNINNQVEISGLNLNNVKSVFLNDTIHCTDISVNSNILTASVSTFAKINSVKVIDGYNNIVTLAISKTIYTNIQPTITDISNSTLGKLIINGTNLGNIQSIIINSETVPVNITSFTINSFLSIDAPILSLFLIYTVQIIDGYNNSYLFTLSIPKYTNFAPIISTVVNNNDYHLLITGNSFLNVKQVLLKDSSNNLFTLTPFTNQTNLNNTFIINNNSIDATIENLITLDKVYVIDEYNNNILFDLNPDIVTDIPPVIQSISSSNFYELDIYGSSLTYINNIKLNNTINFGLSSFVVKNDNLITLSINTVILIESIKITDVNDNSNNFIVSPSIFTNVPPNISQCLIEVNKIILKGTNLLNINSIEINDLINITSFEINNNTTITITISQIIRIKKIKVTDRYNNTSILTFSSHLVTNVPPIITSVDNSEIGNIKIFGSNFEFVTDIMLNNSHLASNYIIDEYAILVPVSDIFKTRSIIVFDKFNNSVSFSDIQEPLPTMPVCFPEGTPVNTDQGLIEINKINPEIHTIRNKKIIAISKTCTYENSIICIEKNALGPNIPNQKTYISRNHRIFYKKHMVTAKALVGIVDNVYCKSYKGEPLYNVLLETHDKMIVNNLIVETLDPESFMGKFYTLGFSNEEKKNMIIQMQHFTRDYLKKQNQKQKEIKKK